MTSKEKDITIQLLELYKDMPYLWDKKHKDYKNKDYRIEGQRVLLEVYKGLEPNATIKTLNKKIQNLRTNYGKELKKVKNSCRTGAGADEIYVPNLYYFDAMNFLVANSESCRRTRDTLETEDLTPMSSDSETTNENQTVSSKPQRKKSRITQASLLEKQDLLMATAGELINYKDKEEDWVVLGKSIGLQLRNLDERSLTVTQKIISDAIYYAKIGLLTLNSSINLGPPITHNFQYTSPSTSSSHSSHRQQSPHHQIQLPQPAPSPHYQIQLTQPAPPPHHQIQSSPHRQMQSSPHHQNIQLPQPAPSPHHQIQLPQTAPSTYYQSTESELQQHLEIDCGFNTRDFTNKSIKSCNNIKIEGKGEVMKDFLIFKPKN